MNILGIKGMSIVVFILLSLALFTCSCTDYAESLGGNWIFDASNLDHPFIRKSGSKEGDPFIPCYVIAHDKNDQFIIAAQKPNTDCQWKGEDAKFADASNLTGNPVNFWIIDIGTDRLIGPLSINKYFQQRQQLGIPDDLKMDVKI